jgi:hypothetical protein
MSAADTSELAARFLYELSDAELAELHRITRRKATEQSQIQRLVVDGLLPPEALPEGARPRAESEAGL